MHDYYSLYTWAMDKQAQIEREARERRLLQDRRHVHIRLSLPVPFRRRDDR